MTRILSYSDICGAQKLGLVIDEVVRLSSIHDFVIVHHFFEKVCSLPYARLAQTFIFKLLVNPIEVVYNTCVNSGQCLSSATCE